MRTKRTLISIALAMACVLTPEFGMAQKRSPHTPEERARFVRITRALEADPLKEGTEDARRELTLWLIGVPDISVTLCTDYLAALYGNVKKREKNYAPEITIQMMFSSAAFIIEHPEKANDEIALNKAGLEGSLRAYQAILKTKPRRDGLSLMN